MPGIAKISRIGIGIAVWIVTISLFSVFPAGAKSWADGFSANLKLTKKPIEIQQWAVSVLDRYRAGQLVTSTNAPYWAVGRAKLDGSNVPPHISMLWREKPSIGIATFTPEGSIADSSENQLLSIAALEKRNDCVVFSWYLSGVLVGRPDFQPEWNPWYIREVIPGMYVYMCMK